ncbi:MAG: LuxR C-terminal-related transcriptional regulator [Polyangiaceae bacterium]
MRFEAAELSRFNSCVLAVHELTQPATFVHDVLLILRELIGAETGLYGVTDLEARRTRTGYSFPAPTEDPEALARFDLNFEDHPLHHRTPAMVEVLAISQSLGREEWHATGLYQEFFRPLGLDDSLMLRLPSATSADLHAVGVARKGFGFSERERFMLSTIGPHIAAAWRRALKAHDGSHPNIPIWNGRRVPETHYCRVQRRWHLSQRQCEVLILLARGLSNKEIAFRLQIAARTVEEHVSQLLRKSGLSNRAGLVAAYWTEGGSSGNG